MRVLATSGKRTRPRDSPRRPNKRDKQHRMFVFVVIFGAFGPQAGRHCFQVSNFIKFEDTWKIERLAASSANQPIEAPHCPKLKLPW